jgi:hypothetical protein
MRLTYEAEVLLTPNEKEIPAPMLEGFQRASGCTGDDVPEPRMGISTACYFVSQGVQTRRQGLERVRELMGD